MIGLSERTHLPDGPHGSDVRYLAESDALFAAWISQHGRAAVVRPDRYVFGTADDAAQLNRLVAAVGRQVLGT